MLFLLLFQVMKAKTNLATELETRATSTVVSVENSDILLGF